MIQARKGADLIVRMFDGEDLVAGLSSVLPEAAWLQGGVGMLRAVRLGYWNGSRYEEHAVPDAAELLSMQGNGSQGESGPVVHCHVTLALKDGRVRGGHLLAATVHNTAEIAVRILEGITMQRKMEPSGLEGLYPQD